MIALLRKDVPWLLAFVIGGTITLTIALAQEHFVRVWALPPTSLGIVFHCGWIAGAALGLCAALYDEALGTREFLRHRPVTPLRLHLARVLGCGLVLIGWLILPALAHWGIEAVFGENVDQGRPGYILDIAGVLSGAASATAIGFFAGTLPCGIVLRLAAGAAVLLAVFTGAHAGSNLEADPFAWERSLPVFAAWHLAAALVCTLGSCANAGAAADPDRPWPPATRRFAGSLATVAFAALAAMCAGVLQRASLAAVHARYPVVLREDGASILAVRQKGGPGSGWQRVDAEHRPGGPPVDPKRAVYQSDSHVERGITDPGFDEPRFRSAQRKYLASAWFSFFRDGTAYRVEREGYTGRSRVSPVGKGAQQSPFVPPIEAIAPREFAPAGLWVAELGTGSLWRYVPEAQHFVQVQLPGSDRLVGHRSVRITSLAGAASQAAGAAAARGEHEVLLGERGVYALEGDDLVPATASVRAAALVKTANTGRVADPDLLSPRLEILDAEGAVRFTHQYAPRTAAERWMAAPVLLWSALRPPFLQVPAHWLAAPGAQRSPFLDPILAGGRRTWLVLACLGCAALSALAAGLRLRRLGAPAEVRRFWIVCGAVCGPAGLLASVVAEPARAHAPSPAGADTPRLPLISSAQSLGAAAPE